MDKEDLMGWPYLETSKEKREKRLERLGLEGDDINYDKESD